MVKQKINQSDIKDLKQSVILLHGVFANDFFPLLKDRDEKVFVMEGRPSLEAAQKNCSALNKMNKTPVLISDNMAGFLFYKNMVKEIWLAYEETDKRGALCYIGASILGILARQHQIPVYCYSAPAKPRQRKTSSKKSKPNRWLAKPEDVISFKGVCIAPKGTAVYAPLMEWVPGQCFTPAAKSNSQTLSNSEEVKPLTSNKRVQQKRK